MQRMVTRAILVAGLFSTAAYAADIAVVNGQGISQAMLEQNLKLNVVQGQKDTPELRKALTEELVNRLLLVQSAENDGLSKTSDARLSLEQLKENYEAGLALNVYMVKHPVTDADVRAEYDRQVAALGGANSQQVQLSLMAVKTEIEAKDVIEKVKKGASFEQQAKDRSIAPSKAQGGKIGWVFPAQLPPELGAPLGKMKKGALSAPIKVQDAWYVLKVDDKRPFKAPDFAASKDQIRQALLQQRRVELLNQLRQNAKIQIEQVQ